MNHNPDIMFSVVIPVYNRAGLVGEALESVLNQTFADFELIVIDDASTDQTPETINEFHDPRLKYIRLEKRSGPSAARNRGAEAGVGKYLAFLDSDDLWRPEKLEKQAEFFSSHPDILVCQTEEIWMRNGKRVYPKPKHKKEGGDFFHRAVNLCLVSPSAVAMERRYFLRIGGFDEDLPAAEDYDLWLRVLSREPIELIPDPLVIKRAGNWDQLSMSTPAIDKYRIIALLKILESGDLDDNKRESARKALERKSRIYIKGCRKRGKSEEIREIQKMLLDAGISSEEKFKP